MGYGLHSGLKKGSGVGPNRIKEQGVGIYVRKKSTLLCNIWNINKAILFNTRL